MPPRNVLLVVTDDHARWCTSVADDPVSTPAIEQLATTGARMTGGACPTPVCSPARASLYTGRLPSQHGVHDHISSDADGRGWLADQQTLPELFGDAGYRTALSGKWHCGQPRQHEVFDRVLGVRDAEGYRPWYATTEGDRRVTDHAIETIRGDKPFFQVVGYTATHAPWEGAPERLVARYRGAGGPGGEDYRFGRPSNEGTNGANRQPGEARAQYRAAVEAVDTQLGRLLDELDRQGVREQTLVVYTADHGLNLGHHGVWGKGNATRPVNFLEESVRVPLVWNGPDVRPGTVRGEFVDHPDTFATLLASAGIDPPAGARPARSYRPALEGAPLAEWPTVQVGEYGPSRVARSHRYTLVRRAYDAPDLLFDREAGGERNVIDDPQNAAVREDLDAAIEATFDGLPTPHDGTDVEALPEHNGHPGWSDV